MVRDVENPMVVDDYWPDYEEEEEEEEESEWERFCRMADEEYEEAVCLAERGIGHMNGYYL